MNDVFKAEMLENTGIIPPVWKCFSFEKRTVSLHN